MRFPPSSRCVPVVLALVAACSSTEPPSLDSGTVPPGDPFAPQPDTSEGLTNVSSDLEAVLEHGALATACSDYAAAPTDRKKRLLCGKAMFFYEGYGTVGVPTPLVDWLLANFPDEVGDRKSTRLNSSHPSISYAVFCLKKKTIYIFPPNDPLLRSSLCFTTTATVVSPTQLTYVSDNDHVVTFAPPLAAHYVVQDTERFS